MNGTVKTIDPRFPNFLSKIIGVNSRHILYIIGSSENKVEKGPMPAPKELTV